VIPERVHMLQWTCCFYYLIRKARAFFMREPTGVLFYYLIRKVRAVLREGRLVFFILLSDQKGEGVFHARGLLVVLLSDQKDEGSSARIPTGVLYLFWVPLVLVLLLLLLLMCDREKSRGH